MHFHSHPKICSNRGENEILSMAFLYVVVRYSRTFAVDINVAVLEQCSTVCIWIKIIVLLFLNIRVYCMCTEMEL